jgi:DNA-binding NarL/FixJ family response regulator
MDFIKESFFRVKKDINLLEEEIKQIKEDLSKMSEQMLDLCKILEKKVFLKESSLNQTNQTHNQTNQTHNQTNQTHKIPFKALKEENYSFSTGNRGVSTDRQTDRQTDVKGSFYKNPLEEAPEILNNIDFIKKDLKKRFKKLTDQEFLVFSTIYQIDEEKGYSNYKELSKRLNLTESSIRDYINHLLKKEIPIEKKRINNKTIILNISQNLKKITSLPTILQLREI